MNTEKAVIVEIDRLKKEDMDSLLEVDGLERELALTMLKYFSASELLQFPGIAETLLDNDEFVDESERHFREEQKILKADWEDDRRKECRYL